MNVIKVAFLFGIIIIVCLLLVVYKQDLEIKELMQENMYLTGKTEYQSSVIADLEEYLREGNL